MTTRTVTVALRATNTQLDTAMRRSAGEVRHLDGEIATVTKTTGGFAGRMAALTPVMKAGGAAGVALGTALGYAAKRALELDKAMRNVNSISGLNDKALDSLQARVVALSKELPQSATTLANGLYDIASSGFQGAEGLKVLEAAGVSASAGLTDTATAAQAITAVLNAYNLDATQAADVSDILFGTVQAGVTTFEQLAHNVGDYIGSAQALGVSFAETGSAIAGLTLTGTNAAQAGTALGAVYNALIKPNEALQAAIEALGYSTASSAVEALGFRGTLMTLAEGTGGSAEAMGQLFTDTQALRAALQMTANDGTKWAGAADLIEDKSNRAGLSQKALAEQSKSVAFQLDIARNKVDAAALSLGNKLLPLLAEGVNGGFAFGQATTDALRPLKPAFEDLAQALEHLISIGGDVTGALAPLVEDLAKLAAVPVVVLFQALAQALETTTGLLADHETLVMALAIAYGVTLAGGVGRVVTAIGVQLVMALANALQGLGVMTAGAASARTALVGLATSSAAATAGLSVALAVGITAWHSYSQGAEEAGAAIEKAKKAMRAPTDITGFATARDEVVKTRDELTRFVNEQQAKPWYAHLLSVPSDAKVLGIGSQLEDLQRAAHDTDLEFRTFQTSVERFFESKLSGPAATEFHNNMVLTGKAFSDAIPTLTAAGVEVTDTFDVIAKKLNDYQSSSTGAAGGSKEVVGALLGMATGATTAGTAVDRLKTGLDKLMGVFLSSDEAAIGFEKALDDMQTTLAKNGATLDINTEKGRANKGAIIDGVKALSAKIEADAAAGQSAGRLSETLTTGRERLIQQAGAAGLSRTAMERLLTQYGLTPALVKTIISAVGIDKAKADAEALKEVYDSLKDKTVAVRLKAVFGTEGTVGYQNDLTPHLKALPPHKALIGLKRASGGTVRACGTGRRQRMPLTTGPWHR